MRQRSTKSVGGKIRLICAEAVLEWTHIDGWSEAVIEYIRALESERIAVN